jgi:serine protease Do
MGGPGSCRGTQFSARPPAGGAPSPSRTINAVFRLPVIIAIVAALPLAGLAQQPRTTGPDGPAAALQIEQSLVETIARAEPSVVAIARTTSQPAPLIERRMGELFGDLRESGSTAAAPVTVGAGVIIDRAGLVLTHYRAVREGDQHIITTIDRAKYPASIRAADPRSGLAVLAIDGKGGSPRRAGAQQRVPLPGSFPAIRLGDASNLRKGQFVIAIGNPYAIQTDGQPTASWGIVTNLARKAPSGTNLNDAPGPDGDYRTTLHHLGTLIQTDAKLAFSAAGGALLNLQGELVGLTTTAATIAGHEQPAGYALPINAAMRRIIDTLKQGREVEYGMLGVGFGHTPLETPSGGSRLTLTQVFPGGPAALAGLEAGDVVTRVGERPVAEVDEVQLAISALPPSTVATVGYIRGGRSGTASVTLSKLAVTGQKITTVRPKAWLGIRVDYATALEALEFTQSIASAAYDPLGCVLVAEVDEGSPAWKAGVRQGMFISHVGRARVTTPKEFEAATRALGDKLDIRLTQPVAAPEPEKASQPQAK